MTIPLGVFRQKREPVKYIVLNVIYTILLLGTSYYLVIKTDLNYKSILIGHVFASFITFSLGFLYIKKHLIFKFDKKLFQKMFSFGFSILLNSLSFVILFGTTRFFLKAAGTFDDVGTLGMAQRISLFVGAILISPFSLAWLPFIKANVEKDNFTYITNRVFTSFLWIAFLFVFALELIQKDVFLLIDNTEYLPSLKYVLPFSLSYIFQGFYFIFSAGIFLSGNNKQYRIIGLSSVFFNLLLYFLFYKYISTGIVAIITLASYGCMMILAFLFGNKKMGIKVITKQNMKILGLYLSLFFIMKLFLNYDISTVTAFSLKITFLIFLFSIHVYYEKRRPFIL
jgi:O-antigen/teichoic acid export membrane protein